MLKCYKKTVSFIKDTNNNELRFLMEFYDIHDKDIFYEKLEQFNLNQNKKHLAKIYFIRCNFFQYNDIRPRLSYNELFETFNEEERLALDVLKNNYYIKHIAGFEKDEKKDNEYYKTFTTGLYANSNLTIEDFIKSNFSLINYEPDYYIDNKDKQDKPFQCICGEKIKKMYHLISKNTLEKFDNKIIILKIGSICRNKFMEVHSICKFCITHVKENYKNININDKVFRCCIECYSKRVCHHSKCKNIKSNIYSSLCVDCGIRQLNEYLPYIENNEVISWTDEDNKEFYKYNS